MCLTASQVVEAKEAGAAGVLGAVANVCGPRGAPVLSSYAAAIGLDCPVEVILPATACKLACMVLSLTGDVLTTTQKRLRVVSSNLHIFPCLSLSLSPGVAASHHSHVVGCALPGAKQHDCSFALSPSRLAVPQERQSL